MQQGIAVQIEACVCKRAIRRRWHIDVLPLNMCPCVMFRVSLCDDALINSWRLISGLKLKYDNLVSNLASMFYL